MDRPMCARDGMATKRPSGNALFDRNAERAIRKASPVPPPPYPMELGVNFYPAGENE